MKTKKFNKLSLNKQTVASLNADKLNAVNGGTGYNTKFVCGKSNFCIFNTTNIFGKIVTGGTRSGYVCAASDNCPPETSDCPSAHTTCTSHMPTGANSGLVCH